MLQNHQVIESLIEMRSHYQSLVDHAERSFYHASKQLEHINPLLVDQLGKKQQGVEALLQLRFHYQSLYSEHQQIAVHTKEQLNHVNALLADQAVLQHNEQQSISTQSATIEQQALQGVIPTADTHNATIAHLGEEFQRQSPEVVQEPESLDGSEQQITLDSSQGQQDRVIADNVKEPSPNLEVVESSDTPAPSVPPIALDISFRAQAEDKSELPELEPPEASAPQISKEPSQVKQQLELESSTASPSVEDSFERSFVDKPAPSPLSRHAAPLKTPLLPQYQHLTKSEAIEKLLHEHSGTILHVDYIIRALDGELPPKDITTEIPRINDSLKKGVAKGLWDRVPDEAGCYTADIKLVDKEVEPKLFEQKKRQPRKPNSKVTEGMLPRYRDLTFTEAVETVLRERSGEIVTTDIMARALYGELEGSALVEAKKKVGKILWSGANQGRWQSVPGQKGAYTLDVSKLR